MVVVESQKVRYKAENEGYASKATGCLIRFPLYYHPHKVGRARLRMMIRTCVC